MDAFEKEEELKRLYRLLHERDKQYEKAKGKRVLFITLCFCAFYFIVLYCFGGNTFKNILIKVALAIFFGSLHFFVNLWIFLPLFVKGREESDFLNSIKEKISKLEQL